MFIVILKMPNRLILLTSTSCGYCTIFKEKKLPELKVHIKQNHKDVQFIHINTNNMADSIPSSYPAWLDKVRVWFPMMVYIPNSNWDVGDFNNIYVFNGIVSPSGGITQLTEKRYTFTIEGMASWLTNSMKGMKIQEKDDDEDVIFTRPLYAQPDTLNLPEIPSASGNILTARTGRKYTIVERQLP